ncbi:MAG: WD40/YVTN/BNR-like repeat-containing protein [Acidimicrobiales bacterium]
MRSLVRRRDEEGQALVLALLFIVMFATVISLLLTQAQATIGLNDTTQSQSKALYGADAGVQWAITQLGSTASCASTGWPQSNAVYSTTLPAGVTLPGVTSVSIACQQATGPGSNLFAGTYALITGVGYPSTDTQLGSTTCQSISTDPVGGGTPTLAKGSGGCLTYPSGTGVSSPLWTNDTALTTPAPTQQLNGIWAVDNSDIWAAGNAGGGQETIWYFDGDGFTDVTTASNTSAVTNANLNAVWASGTNSVWAVGNASGANGTILYCSANCSTSSSVWVLQRTPTNAQLNDVFGTSATNVYAVGNAASGAGTVLSYNSLIGTWSALGTFGVNKNLLAVYATGPNDVWVTGQSGTIDFWNGTTWVAQVAAPGAPDLTTITGTDSSHLWAAGNNFLMTCTANCTSATATWVKVANLPSGNPNIAQLVAGDATDVWAVASNNIIDYCSAACSSATGGTWVSQMLPSGTAQLNDAAAVAPTGAGSWGGNVWAAGNNGTILSYTPPSTSIQTLASVSGGAAFNAQGTNFATGLQVQNNFTQYQTSGTCQQPANLVVSSGFNYTCTSTIPAGLQTLNEPAPWGTASSAQSPPSKPTAQSGTLVAVNPLTYPSCSSYVVFTPGWYNSKISFTKNTTYYFVSGLYYFTGGFGPFDNGTSGTDNLYVIGGAPSTGDSSAIASVSPCWAAIQASSYYTTPTSYGGSGTGVDWVLGGSAWMDVHTVNLELFTREGGPSSEGAQGISIRDVPPECTGSQTPGYGPSCLTSAQFTAGWSPTSSGGADQVFQVDAANHLPQVFVHGALYVPSSNIEEFTNQAGVVLGPIDCNSLELSFESATSPMLNIEAGTGYPEAALIATAYGAGQPFQVEGLWGYATGATKPSMLNWWVISRS